jgi:hypothetical protein
MEACGNVDKGPPQTPRREGGPDRSNTPWTLFRSSDRRHHSGSTSRELGVTSLIILDRGMDTTSDLCHLKHGSVFSIFTVQNHKNQKVLRQKLLKILYRKGMQGTNKHLHAMSRPLLAAHCLKCFIHGNTGEGWAEIAQSV